MPKPVEFRASDMKRIGPVFDAAQRGPVCITRHSTRFVLVEEARFKQIIADASDPRPRTLEDLVAGYDRAGTRVRLDGWMKDAPAGKERL